MAALALVRALTQKLLTAKLLSPDEVEDIRHEALTEFMTNGGDDPSVLEARLAILHKFLDPLA